MMDLSRRTVLAGLATYAAVASWRDDRTYFTGRAAE